MLRKAFSIIKMPEIAPKIQIIDFFSSLFWDVDSGKVDLKQSKKWLVERVLEHADLNDWKRFKK